MGTPIGKGVLLMKRFLCSLFALLAMFCIGNKAFATSELQIKSGACTLTFTSPLDFAFTPGPQVCGAWTITTATGTGTSPSPALISSVSIDATATKGAPDLFVNFSENGFTSSPIAAGTWELSISGTQSTLLKQSSSLKGTGWIDTTNTLLGMTGPAIGPLGPITGAAFSSTTSGGPGVSSGPYSMTEQLDITDTGKKGSNVSITETLSGTAVVPEPASLTMFGTGLIGLAVLLRRKLSLA